MWEAHPMTLSLTSTTSLHGTVNIPRLGLGVFRVKGGPEVEQAVAIALELGYRHVDTAVIYRNEEGVGRAIAASGIDRSEVYVTTKLWNSNQGYQSALSAIDTSLGKLGMDYVDLYLVHWPKPEHTADTSTCRPCVPASASGRGRGRRSPCRVSRGWYRSPRAPTGTPDCCSRASS